MPWKEPGDKPSEPRDRPPRGREPWGRGSGSNDSGPDLDAWLAKARRRLGPFGRGPLGALAVIVLVLVLWWVIGGWSMVGNQQVGVLLRFGRLDAVLQPGLHLHLPTPIDRVTIVDMGRTRTLSDEVRLLTADGQLALVDYYVQYKVADARKFLFAARDAEETARNAAAVAMRALVGTHTLQQLQQREDGQFGKLLQNRLGSALAGTDIGISVTGAGIQNVGVPSEAKQAFDGIAKAHQDAKAAQATAHADVARNKVEATVQAAALQTAADSYRASSIAEAQASVARFGQILAQYQAAPQVTRHRLWLDAMHDVLTKNHVVVNTGSGNVIVQFPPRQSEPASSPAPASTTPDASAPASAASVAPVTSGPALSGVGT